MGRRATIQMVAEKAGVSRGTVDRVINSRGYVKEEVRERVLAAMQELEYKPVRMEQAKTLGLLETAPAFKLGVLLPDWGGHFLQEVSMGIKGAAAFLKDFGTEVMIERCQTELPSEFEEKVDLLVKQGAEGIALCGKNHPIIARKIDEMVEKGIPVITYNSDIPGTKRLCFVGEDVPRGGRVAGELMCKCVPNGAKVLAAVGNLEFDGHKQRLQGFLEQMEKNGFARENIEIVQTYNDYALSYKRVSETIKKMPDLAGVYMANHSVTACAEAISDEGKERKIRVISHDTTAETRRLLKEGSVDLVVEQDLYTQGYQPLILLYNLLKKGERPEQVRSQVSIGIVCAQNIN